MNSSQKATDEHGRASGRKPYMKPQVQVYGDVREITQSVGNVGNNDAVLGKKTST